MGTIATPAAISALNLVPFNVQNIGGALYVTYAPTGLSAQRNAPDSSRRSQNVVGAEHKLIVWPAGE